jgi:hypothetical protein
VYGFCLNKVESIMHTEKSIRVVVEKDQFPFKRVFYLGR